MKGVTDFLGEQPRLPIDALGALRHMICRGIERKAIFQDDAERWEGDKDWHHGVAVFGLQMKGLYGPRASWPSRRKDMRTHSLTGGLHRKEHFIFCD